MKTEKQFEEIVQNMSAREIIMTMVNSLKNPITEINMQTYGKVDSEGICYGCAATNFICSVAEITTTDMVEAKIDHRIRPFNTILDTSGGFLFMFESAINYLRVGDLLRYNTIAVDIGIEKITNNQNISLSILDNGFTPGQLETYVLLANTQE